MKQKKKEKIIIQEVKKKIYKKVYKEKEGDERGGRCKDESEREIGLKVFSYFLRFNLEHGTKTTLDFRKSQVCLFHFISSVDGMR